MKAAVVASRVGYNAIGACVICGFPVTSATAASKSGYTWLGVLVVVAGWMFGGVGCHATSKGAELSYKLGYLIHKSLFNPVCIVHTVCPDIICISWISTFHGHYPHFVDISAFCGYYLHTVDIVDISTYSGYYLYWSQYKLLRL